MTERTTVRLPPELLRRAKRKAVQEGRTLTSLIEDGLRRVLDEREAIKSKERVLPPVSKATGGLMPGFDWDRLATQAQEMEDMEYARKHL